VPLLHLLDVVIVFGALVPLFALQKANSPPLSSVTR